MSGLLGATVIPSGSTVAAAVGAINAWGALVTQPQSMKVYFTPGEFPTAGGGGSTIPATAGFQLGMRVCLCYKPLPSNVPNDLATLVASIQSFQAQAASLGAPTPVVCLWAEPQDSANATYGINAPNFLSVVAAYQQAIRAPYSPGVSCGLKLCYDGAGQSPSLAASWFPGPPNFNPLTGVPFAAPVVDIVAVDFYAGDFGAASSNPKLITNWLNLASGQGGLYPPMPFGVWEMGNAESSKVVTQAEMAAYFSYIISVMAPLAQQGLADACMWYQDEQGGFSGVNIIPGSTSELTPGDPASDYRIPMLLALQAALNPAAPVGAQPLTIPDFGPVTGTQPEAAQFNSLIQVPFSFLTSKTVFRAELDNNPGSAGQLSAGQTTLIPYDTVLEDPYQGWNPATSSWQCPAGMSGTYLITVTAAAQSAGDAVSTLQVVPALNGNTTFNLSNVWMPQQQTGMASGSVPLALCGGQDQISAYAYWNGNSSSQLSVNPGRRCTIEITWQSL